MKYVVIKFGGSNLKSREDLFRIIKVLKSYDRPVIVVVSALYGITDRLNDALRRIQKSRKEIKEIIVFLKDTHLNIIKQYIDESEKQKELCKRIEVRIEELEKKFKGINYFGEVPDFVHDWVLSFGERLSSLLLCSLLNVFGIDATEALPEDIGLITDGIFNNACIDFEASIPTVQKTLSENKTYIIPGFYGVSKEGKVTLLGRGGSDYSAAAIARCVQAESLDLWKDVSGFSSVDPQILNNAIPIKKLNYSEAAELSYFGAKILHPQTVEPLLHHSIPLRIFNINTFSGELQPVTYIADTKVITPSIIKSVTYSDDFAILELNGPGVGIKPGIMAEVTTILNEYDINIKSIITTQTKIKLLLSKSDIDKGYQLAKSLHLITLDEIKTEDDISLIAVVGEGILNQPGIAARTFQAVFTRGINVRLISAGASDVAIYFIVSKNDKIQAVKAIHEEFFCNIEKLNIKEEINEI
ncbi:MAG: aspartate kinase [Candidatus Cloacimonetes bacterium]|nr:aspartate kinase [Candidatus Cloacimonadota bacterium]